MRTDCCHLTLGDTKVLFQSICSILLWVIFPKSTLSNNSISYGTFFGPELDGTQHKTFIQPPFLSADTSFNNDFYIQYQEMPVLSLLFQENLPSFKAQLVRPNSSFKKKIFHIHLICLVAMQIQILIICMSEVKECRHQHTAH